MARKRLKIGEILIEWQVLDQAKLDEALAQSQAMGRRVGEVLVESGAVSETDIAKALARQFEMEYIDLDQPRAIPADKLELIPLDVIQKHEVLPLDKVGNRLKIITHDPLDFSTLDTLRFRLNCEIETAISSREKIRYYIEHFNEHLKKDKEGLADRLAKGEDVGSADDIELTKDKDKELPGEDVGSVGDADSAPIIRLVDKIITDAVNGRASDIHIEPFADRVRVRYRVDGVCIEGEALPKINQSAVTARVKIMSGMKIEEKRVPQDGRIKLKVGEANIDFRVAACPSYYGESIVLRILRPDSARIGLVNLGMREDTMERFQKIIKRPNGIFLVTGPTGSGKTTTLYSALDVLNRPDRKIITAEEPVEYMFKGINQCQVNEHVGLTFERILRAMLRQAPNIILVGEIRDKAVGEVAIQAALTGHLVFSTLHTNDAPSAITRLIDMGIKPFLVASSIQAVLAQRLVRMLCEKCKEPDTEPSLRKLRTLGMKPSDLEGRTLYKARGCAQCNYTGYRGRRGIYELMAMNGELRELAFKRAPLSQLRAAVNASGMRSLLGDGRLKILDGLTTLDEIATIVQAEGVVEMEDVDDEMV